MGEAVILLWGVPGDDPLAAIRDELIRQEQPVAFIDQRAVLETDIELLVDATVAGTIRQAGRTIDLETVTAVYQRSYSPSKLPAVQRADSDGAALRHAHAATNAFLSWVELTPALAVNRPTAIATNASKPYQAGFVGTAGFDVPDTLITTDPEAVREFSDRHGAVIYKSISSERSIVSRLTPEHLSRLDDIVSCPTQFQQHVPGQDHRVHVVGETTFASAIVSDADDYRYAARQGTKAQIRPTTVPDDVAERCCRLSAKLGLAVAGVDLRRTPDDRWFCFEVNPSPAFTYYQERTGQRIDRAIVELLTTAARPPVARTRATSRPWSGFRPWHRRRRAEHGDLPDGEGITR